MSHEPGPANVDRSVATHGEVPRFPAAGAAEYAAASHPGSPAPATDPGNQPLGGGQAAGHRYPSQPGQPYLTPPPPAAPSAWPARPGSPARPARSPRRLSSLLVAGTTALALAAGVAGGYAGSAWQQTNATSNSAPIRLTTAAPAAGASSAAPATGSVQQVAAAVLPSTVSVLASSAQGMGEGSGVVLTADGLILTNAHVVDGAAALEVQLNDGRAAAATLVGKTTTDDLSVIKAQGVSGLTPATLGSSADLQVGQPVVAIGSPLGLSATVTSGIVSALNRPVRTSSPNQTARTAPAQDTVINAIQTDAAINPGNSGGALVDMSGNVIGINSAIASLSSSATAQSGSIGVGFAIPIDQARRIAQEIIDTGTAAHAQLGASVSDATDSTGQITTGAKVSTITPGGGAAAAGLQPGDVITGVATIKVESADALIAAIRSQAPNTSANITFVRNGKSQTVDVTLGSAPSA